MKMKRLLAVALAALMAATLAPAVPAKAEEIDGTTIFVKKEVYDLTLPTTASQKFYLDPQGLIAIGKGGSAAANEGTIIGKNEMYAINQSSVPVALTATYKIKDSASDNGITIVSSSVDESAIEDLQKAKIKQIALSVSANEVSSVSSNNYGGHVFKADDTNGVNMTATTGMTADCVYANADGVDAAYLMTAETYKAQLKTGKTDADAYDPESYEFVIDSTAEKASCVQLVIGGYCSKNADWSDYAKGTETLKLDIVFKFKKVDTTAGDYTDAKVASSEIQQQVVTLDDNGLITITGLTSAKNYSDILLSNGTATSVINNTVATRDESDWSSSDGGTLKIQLIPAKWNTWYSGKEVTVTVTLSDSSTITCKHTMP